MYKRQILCGAQAQTPGSEVPNLKKLYELTDSCDVNVRARFSPLIGISASISSGASRVGATYIQSIVKAGGTPIIIPAVTDGKVLRNIVSNLDGLVLIGGADVNPLWYEEEPREKLEMCIRDSLCIVAGFRRMDIWHSLIAISGVVMCMYLGNKYFR